MVSRVHTLLHAQYSAEGTKGSWSDHETHLSTASTEDIATDCFTDDDEVPPMVALKRNTTLTEYNEDRSFEWQRPHLQHAGMEVPAPPIVVPSQTLHAAPLQAHAVVYPAQFVEQASCTGVYVFQSRDNDWNHSQGHDVFSWEDQLQCTHTEGHATSQSVCENVRSTKVKANAHGLKFYESQDICRDALPGLRGNIAELAFQQIGCRMVQDAFQVADLDTARDLATELLGYVRTAATSQHANFVIQKIIEELPPSCSDFIAHELQAVACSVAKDRCGCRILCRLFERNLVEPASRNLAEELFQEAGALCRHPFAHHPMQAILEHGQPEQRHSIVQSLVCNFWANAQIDSSSYVIESAMIHCSAEELKRVIAAISSGTHKQLVSLLHCKAGNRVLRALPKMKSQSTQALLQRILDELQGSDLMWQGKRILQELSRGVERPVTP